jgi:hypothetical protein
MRKDVVFAREQCQVSERRACKLLGVDRGSYRYEPRADRNGPLREALLSLARQKPRYGYRRLHALLEWREHPVSAMRIYRLYRDKRKPFLRSRYKFIEPTSDSVARRDDRTSRNAGSEKR